MRSITVRRFCEVDSISCDIIIVITIITYALSAIHNLQLEASAGLLHRHIRNCDQPAVIGDCSALNLQVRSLVEVLPLHSCSVVRMKILQASESDLGRASIVLLGIQNPADIKIFDEHVNGIAATL